MTSVNNLLFDTQNAVPLGLDPNDFCALLVYLHLVPMMMKGLVSQVIDGFGRCCHMCRSSVNGVEDAHKNKD